MPQGLMTGEVLNKKNPTICLRSFMAAGGCEESGNCLTQSPFSPSGLLRIVLLTGGFLSVNHVTQKMSDTDLLLGRCCPF